MGVSPHLLYQAAHEGRARLLGGWTPLSSGLESTPPPLLLVPACHALGVHADWGVHFGLQWGPGFSPVPACCAMGAHAAQGVSPLPQSPGSGVSLPPAQACHTMGAHAAVQPPPPFLWARPAHRRRGRSVPCSLLPPRGVHPPLLCLLDRGLPLLLLGHTVRWERTLPYRGVPPVVRARLAVCPSTPMSQVQFA